MSHRQLKLFNKWVSAIIALYCEGIYKYRKCEVLNFSESEVLITTKHAFHSWNKENPTDYADMPYYKNDGWVSLDMLDPFLIVQQ